MRGAAAEDNNTRGGGGLSLPVSSPATSLSLVLRFGDLCLDSMICASNRLVVLRFGDVCFDLARNRALSISFPLSISLSLSLSTRCARAGLVFISGAGKLGGNDKVGDLCFDCSSLFPFPPLFLVVLLAAVVPAGRWRWPCWYSQRVCDGWVAWAPHHSGGVAGARYLRSEYRKPKLPLS